MSDDTVEVISLAPQCYQALSSTRKSLGTRLHTHTLHCTYTHTHIRTHTHYIPVHTHTHTCTHTHAHTRTHMHTHAHTCTHMHTLYTLTTYTHTHTHKHTDTHTMQPLQPWMKCRVSTSHLKATPTIRGAFLPGSLLKVVNIYICTTMPCVNASMSDNPILAPCLRTCSSSSQTALVYSFQAFATLGCMKSTDALVFILTCVTSRVERRRKGFN